MSIKTKVALGVIFLFGLMVAVGGLGIYYVKSLSQDAQNLLVDNYESLEYSKTIIERCDRLKADSASALKDIESGIEQQEHNITEVGEETLTRELRIAFEKLKMNGLQDTSIVKIRQLSLAIQELNMKAIIRKNKVTHDTSRNASSYLMIIVTICALVAFTFIVNFPGYIANPIVQLTSSIKLIAGKNYEERLHFSRKDEFEELAEAFNDMAEKLDEYEHSNLAKILFEKKRIETIINRMTDPVVGLDENSRVIFVNDQALNLLNLGLGDIQDKYAPDVAVSNDLFRSMIRHEQTTPSALIKVAVSGRENYFSKELILIKHVPTGEKDAVTIGQVILLRNITTFKELDLAKTNFIATISHELKTPIASLQMGIKLLQDARVGPVNDEQRHVVSTLHEEMTRLSRITNELLDLSQVETGNIKLNMRKTDPLDVVRKAVEAVKFQAERKQVSIEIADGGGLQALADEDKTTWVMVNFLTNAIRYSPENGKIMIRCGREEEMIYFSVTDEGPGIDEKYVSRLFEKFFKVPGAASGTGLGLAISKEFIEAQGGQILVRSVPGAGSTFLFRLHPYI